MSLKRDLFQMRPVRLKHLPYLLVFLAAVVFFVEMILQSWTFESCVQLPLQRKAHPILLMLLKSTIMKSQPKKSSSRQGHWALKRCLIDFSPNLFKPMNRKNSTKIDGFEVWPISSGDVFTPSNADLVVISVTTVLLRVISWSWPHLPWERWRQPSSPILFLPVYLS